MKNSEIFIEKYKELEALVRITYNIKNENSISYYLINNTKYKSYKEEIKYCQNVRNLLSHEQKIDNQFAVEPNDLMIDFINRLINQIKNRKRCMDIAVKFSNIYWQPENGSVKESIKIMREKSYTHIPILSGGKVIGVFDENSIFNYLADEEIIEISDELKFSDIERYLSIRDREMEEFVFFKSNSYVEELEIVFEKALNNGKRIGLAFITATGKENEKLQGIISPWDIIAATN